MCVYGLAPCKAPQAHQEDSLQDQNNPKLWREICGRRAEVTAEEILYICCSVLPSPHSGS